jgi:penicillin-binding protein 1C
LLFTVSSVFIIITTAVIHGLIDIRLVHKSPSFLLLDRSYKFIASVENNDGDYGYWEMPEKIPASLRITALAAEDRRFSSHPGVDIHSIIRAVRDNYITHGSYSGASTIAMQVARLQRGGSGGWYFKIHDAVTAAGLTAIYGRERVLRQYFRIAPYGNRISGAACASRRYFHKPVQDLSFAEAALLASVPKAPSRYNLFNDYRFESAKKRGRLIINRAFKYGWISSVTCKEALAELDSLKCPEKQLRDESCFHFINACKTNINAADNGEIRTTLDLDVQKIITGALTDEIPRIEQFEANNAAAIVVEIKTGHVLGYTGSLDYYNPKGGAIDCAAIPRSTGSLLKPFIYAAGMEWQGYTAATILTDLGFDFGTGNRPFIPEDFDRKYMGPVLYKCALANSRNIPAVQVLKAVGVDIFYRMCIGLGLTYDDGRARFYGLGLSIGGLYCTLQQLSAAYLTLADNGKQRKLVWRMDSDSSKFAPRHIIRPEIAMQIKRFLSDPDARLPSFPRGGNMEYPFAVAIKTGTSEGFRDAWCFGISDKYIAGVWIGNTDFTSTKKMSGYEEPARVVKKILLSLHPERVEGLNDVEFPPPDGYEPVEICRLTGKLADRFTPYITTEYFKPGTEPVEYSNVQQLLPIDKRNGLLAYPGCKAPIEYRRFIVVDPQYHDWAQSQGLEVPPERYSPLCGSTAMLDSCKIEITSPRNGSRFYIDPEMPLDKGILLLKCNVDPPQSAVLWFVNNEEYKVVNYPYKLEWPMKPGVYEFQAAIPHTAVKSKAIKIEVY